MMLPGKKHLIHMMIMLILSLLIVGIGYANDDSITVNLISPSTQQVYKPGETVEISGTAQGLIEVALAIRNEQGILLFMAQPKVEDGAFTASFTLPETAVDGEYTLTLGALGLSGPQHYTFEVSKDGGASVELQKPLADEPFEPGAIVEITGTAQRMENIAICVRNSKRGRIYAAQPSVDEEGCFTTHFTLPEEGVEGECSIVMTGAGLATAQIANFTVDAEDETGSDPGGQVPQEDPILFIQGNGVNKKVSFTRTELEEMNQERQIFSTVSDWPSNSFVAGEGVPLQDLLDEAQMKSSATLINIEGTDGYNFSFTVEELLEDTRCYYPKLTSGSTSGKEAVEPILALQAAGKADFGRMTEKDTPVVYFGQRALSEQTLIQFVREVETITVSTESSDQWDEPTAKIMAPGSNEKDATDGGDIEAGSKIILKGDLKAKVYYTTDGSKPDLDSKMYNISHHDTDLNKPIVVEKSTCIKAMVVGPGKEDSDVVTFEFIVDGQPIENQNLDESQEPQPVIDTDDSIKKEPLNLANGRKGEQLTLQTSALEDIEEAEEGSQLALTSTSKVDEVRAEVPAKVLQKAEEKGLSVTINSLIGHYTLPLNALMLSQTAAELGVKVAELDLNIVISRVTDEVKDKLAGNMPEGQAMLVDPVEFKIEITAPNGKKAAYQSFGRTYVERTIPLTNKINNRQATGAVWNEAKSKFLPVPTRFETRDGESFAVILNRTNSLYTVLQSHKTYDDIQDSWAKADIELLASKMLINGKSATTYEPASNITRAEFAALLARALGLQEGTLQEGQFKDVAAAAWYAGSVAAATSEDIIKGYEGNLFKPNSNITRQEMAVMIARAARVVGKEGELSDSAQAQQLAQFKDKEAIPDWAAKSVALAADAEMIKGMPDGHFAPQMFADRAQSAVILKRFLTYINFITID